MPDEDGEVLALLVLVALDVVLVVLVVLVGALSWLTPVWDDLDVVVLDPPPTIIVEDPDPDPAE